MYNRTPYNMSELVTMYPAQANSPETSLSGALTAAGTTVFQRELHRMNHAKKFYCSQTCAAKQVAQDREGVPFEKKNFPTQTRIRIMTRISDCRKHTQTQEFQTLRVLYTYRHLALAESIHSISDVGIRLRGNEFQLELSPHPAARRLSMRSDGFAVPLSSLLIFVWWIPVACASWFCVRWFSSRPSMMARTICSSGSNVSHSAANAGSCCFFSIASFRLIIVSTKSFHRFVSSRAAGSSSNPANARYGLSAQEKTSACLTCTSSCFLPPPPG